MLLDLIEGVVAHHVEPLQVVREEYLEVVVVGLVQGGVDVVVVRTGVRGILNFEILHKYEVLDHFHVFNLSIFAEEGADGLLPSLIEPTHIEFTNQNALVDAFRRLSLLHQLFLLGLGQFGEHVVHCQIIGNCVVADGQSNFLLFLFAAQLLFVAALP